ncbi:MAG: tyrosine decarboxylase MfnA [Halodesulfurarchaeum sp.]
MSECSDAALPTPQSFDRVLSSMCTVPHPDARQAAERFLETNPGDPGTYPTVAELEDKTVSLLGEVVGLDDPHGYVASGGTEANIQAVRAARNLASTDRPNVVIGEHAHFSFRKAAELLDVEIRSVPTDPTSGVDPEDVARSADDDTILVVGVAGSTEYGAVDPIPALSRVASEADALLHVDAAFGGFVLPFTEHEWNFEDASIDTMTIDPHKMGRAAIPAGGFITRGPAILEALAVETPYLEQESQVSLLGTRSGAGVASAYAAMRAQWPDIYRESTEAAMNRARWLATELRDRGFPTREPVLPIVTSSVPHQCVESLRSDGWRISRTEGGDVRIVCMPHVDRSVLESFLSDLDARF